MVKPIKIGLCLVYIHMGRLIGSSWICLPPCRAIINYECGVQRDVLSIHKKVDCTPLFPPFCCHLVVMLSPIVVM